MINLKFSKIKFSKSFYAQHQKRLFSIKQESPKNDESTIKTTENISTSPIPENTDKTTTDTTKSSSTTTPKKAPKLQLNLLKWYLDNAQTPSQLLV